MGPFHDVPPGRYADASQLGARQDGQHVPQPKEVPAEVTERFQFEIEIQRTRAGNCDGQHVSEDTPAPRGVT